MDSDQRGVNAHGTSGACPAGWSKLDFVFGWGATCDVNVAARDATALLCCLLCGTNCFCTVYIQWRKRAKGETRTSMYRALSLGSATMLCNTLWPVVGLLFPSTNNIERLSLIAAAGAVWIEYLFHSSQAFLNNAIDTVHALRPARAALWHGRVASLVDLARPVFAFTWILGSARIMAGNTAHDDALTHRGVQTTMGSFAAASLLATGLMTLGAMGTARAARAMGRTSGTEQLCKRLWRQHRAAVALAFCIAITGVVWGTVALHSPTRRIGGIVNAACLASGCTVASAIMLPRTLRSMWQRSCGVWSAAHATRQVSVVPLRRVSDAEAITATADPGGPSVATAAVGLISLARRGVSLAFLRALAEQKGVGARATTAEVCENVVKPATASARCAYYDLLARDDAARAGATTAGARGEQWIGESDYFLSHTWSFRFRDLLDIIETFERQAGRRYKYWFDIFVMNQHSHEGLGQDKLLQSLIDSIKAPGRVLLAMDSWRDPSPLTRVWCLLEIFTAMSEGAELVMCLSSAEQASFAEKLGQNQAEVQRVLEGVDAERAEATVDSDRELIFALIRQGKGFAHFNRTIRDALCCSFERVAVAQRRL